MKNPLARTLNSSHKPRLIAKLCVILALACITVGLTACQKNGAGASNDIDNISLLKAGNTYSFNGNNLTISYGGGSTAHLQLPIDVSVTSADEQTGVYISDEITAIAYGGLDGKTTAEVIVSSDKGKTWNSYAVNGLDSLGVGFIGKRIGFLSTSDGWLVLDGNAGAGTQRHYIFQTADGGKNWSQIGDANQVYAKMLTGAGFATDNIGFLCFEKMDDSLLPTIFSTDDKGKTWGKLELAAPRQYQDSTHVIEALSPVFYGSNGVLPVIIYNTSGSVLNQEAKGQYTTSDSGKTWAFDDSSVTTDIK